MATANTKFTSGRKSASHWGSSLSNVRGSCNATGSTGTADEQVAEKLAV